MTGIAKELTIAAPRETVWRYLSEPDLLAGWLMRNSFTPIPGSAFHFFAPPHGTWDGQLDCKLVAFEPPARIAFTWDANDIGGETLVSIELEERDGATLLKLNHTAFPDNEIGDEARKRHDDGWTRCLATLALQAEEDAGGRPAPTQEIDWSRFDLHVAITAAPERVIDCWTTSAGMESFFVEMMRITDPEGCERGPEERARAGDPFTWRWHSGRCVQGEYLAPMEASLACFTFGESKVRVEAQPYDGGSLLRLTQFDMADTPGARSAVYKNCYGAWVHFLTNLKSVLETGHDVRDHSRATGAVFSTFFDPAEVGVGFSD